MDVLSKSDPECFVYIRDNKNKNYTLIGKTETVNNNLNPDFTKHFTLDYFFEREQFLKFEVYDVDINGKDHIGNCEITIGKLMTSSK